MVRLVRELQSARLSHLQAVVFFRLPVDADRLSWAWPTMEAVLEGKEPRAHLVASAEKDRHGAYKIVLHNAGNADATPSAVMATWSGSRFAAGDSLSGFTFAPSRSSAVFSPGDAARRSAVAPGDAVVAGWVRLGGFPSPEVEARVMEYDR